MLSVTIVASFMSQRYHVQQTLIKSVERNIDGIEIENGLLDIERDFAYTNDGVYSIVFNKNGKIISGEYPDGVEKIDLSFDSGNVRKYKSGSVNYFVYDTLLKFNKFEYRIDSKTGEILSSEAEFSPTATDFQGDLDTKAKDSTLSLRDAFRLVLKETGLNENEVHLVTAQIHDYHYNNTVYEIEYLTDKSIYDDVWIRGVSASGSESNEWNAIVIVAVIFLPIFILMSSVIGTSIAKRAYKPIENLSLSVSRINTGDDLSERVTVEDSDPVLRQLEENCNLMLERLQQSFESEKQFTSDASHELRTPVTVILAECDYQLGRNDLDDESREALSDIREKALAMKELIQQLLYFARMEQGKALFDFAPNDLTELTDAVAGDIASIAQNSEKHIKIHTDLEKGIIFNMDAGLMARLIENLISNAVRYGNPDGNVWVKLSKDRNVITLSVKDDGIGISKEDAPKIWQRFYRADKARGSGDGCQGLGLPMVKQIAEMHGGHVTLESEEGKGSEFKVIFDVKE